MVWNLRSGFDWVPGVIVERLGPVSYLVETKVRNYGNVMLISSKKVKSHLSNSPIDRTNLKNRLIGTSLELVWMNQKVKGLIRSGLPTAGSESAEAALVPVEEVTTTPSSSNEPVTVPEGHRCSVLRVWGRPGGGRS